MILCRHGGPRGACTACDDENAALRLLDRARHVLRRRDTVLVTEIDTLFRTRYPNFARDDEP